VDNVAVKAIEVLYQRSLKQLSGQLRYLVERRLWLQVLIGKLSGRGVPV
jgi:hypothetical protein